MVRHNRWTPKRKQDALAEIAKGTFTRDDFMAANSVGEEEMAEWERGHFKTTVRRLQR